MVRPWHLLLVFAALLVPLQAGALGGGGSALTVSAGLDYCGAGENGISCKIDASWSGVEGADRYTATATLADGSVTDLGTVGSGSGGGATSLWVPYAGNGVYSVTITAWGSDPEGKEEKLDETEADTDVEDEAGKNDGKGVDDEPKPAAEQQPPAEDTAKQPSQPVDPEPEPAPADPVEEPATPPDDGTSSGEPPSPGGEGTPTPASAGGDEVPSANPPGGPAHAGPGAR